MSKEIQGHLNGHNLKLAVIVSRFNEFITSKLLDGAKSSLKLNGVKDEHITIVKVPGSLKSTKAVGWYIDEYSQAQVSINLTNFNETPPHLAFEETRDPDSFLAGTQQGWHLTLPR